MVSLTTSAILMPDAPRTLVRLVNAFSTCSAMSDVDGGEPSSPIAVWPEHTSTCEGPAKSTACENPKAFDHSQGLTSLRSTRPPRSAPPSSMEHTTGAPLPTCCHLRMNPVSPENPVELVRAITGRTVAPRTYGRGLTPRAIPI